ncbi:MAG: hypothetical protein GX027_04435 [Clostridiaceae bacterium]|jgi:ABC-2 type transport system permease protein|nr:hypothetical protein [Clostridiaceae bacterium]
MRLKTSSFNKGIYFFNLKRFWLTAFSFAFLLTLNILNFLRYVSANTFGSYSVFEPGEVALEIFRYSDILVTFLFPFFSLISALAVFSHIHFQKNTAMIHALPIDRKGLFTTHYLSGLTLVLLPLAVSGAILIVGELLMGITHIAGSLLWMLVSAVILFLLYSFAVFVGMFTGHLAAHALFFFIFNFLAVFLKDVIRTVLMSLLYGYASSSYSLVDPFSPIVYLEEFFSGFSIGKGNYLVLVCYLAAGLAFVLGARAVYRKRHMETAGDVISLKVMKPVFKYSVAFCSSALLGSIIVSLMNFGRDFPVFLISYLIGGFIGYFAAEMLLKKTFGVFRHIKGFLIFALVIVFLLSSINFDFFGYETYVPDASDVEIMYVGNYPDEYAKIALDPDTYDPDRHRYLLWDSDYRDHPPARLDENMIRLLRQRRGVLENPETIERAVAFHRVIAANASSLSRPGFGSEPYYYESPVVRYFNLTFTYRLKNGRTVQRAYFLPYKVINGGELETAFHELLTSAEFMEKSSPLLTVKAEDLNIIQVLFHDENNTALNLAAPEEKAGFLEALRQDILNTDPFNLFINYKEGNTTSIEITFYFKADKALVFQDGGTLHISGRTLTIRLWSDYENTLLYLESQLDMDTELWQKIAVDW